MFEIIVSKRETQVKPKSVYTQIEPEEPGKDAVYAYVMKDVEEEVTIELYKQQVDTLDLVAVIHAVNGLDKP